MGGKTGYLVRQVEDVKQSGIGIDLSMAVYGVGIVQGCVGMCTGMGEDIDDFLRRQVGLGLQP